METTDVRVCGNRAHQSSVNRVYAWGGMGNADGMSQCRVTCVAKHYMYNYSTQTIRILYGERAESEVRGGGGKPYNRAKSFVFHNMNY